MDIKKIVYFGDIGIPNSASAIHVYNRAKLLKNLGIEVHVICMTPKNKEKIENDEIVQYHYLPSIEGKGKIRGIRWNIDLIFANETYSPMIKAIKDLKPDAIILYEVNSIILQNKVKNFCKKNSIKIIIETTEWMEMDKERGISGNLIVWQKDIQKKYTDKKCKNIIAISTFLEEHYKSQKCNVIRIPPLFSKIISEKEIKRVKDIRNSADIRLIFAGSLSNKDYLIEVLEALLVINQKDIKVSFDVIGPSQEEIKRSLKIEELEKYGIYVYGRLEHKEVLKKVQQADFSVLFRQNKRYAKAGVSTKFCEAMVLGVPSICTQVNGTDSFITNGKNGFLIKENTKEAIINILIDILKLNNEQILKMKKNAYEFAEQNFLIDNYLEKINQFLKECK